MATTIRQKNFEASRSLYEYDILDPKGKVVGMAQLRVNPSKAHGMPEGFESHVYYEIGEKYQGKSYAKDALSEILKKAADFRINPLIATVNSNNLPSIKIIEACGGQKVAEDKLASGELVFKYALPTTYPTVSSF